eukprot:Em0002g466a
MNEPCHTRTQNFFFTVPQGSHELPTIEDFETVPSPPSSHVTPEAAKSTSHSSQPATTKQVSTPSRSQMELPLRAGTNRRTALSGSESTAKQCLVSKFI